MSATLAFSPVIGQMSFTNMALRKPTWQLTWSRIFSSDNAVDGNNDTNAFYGGCMVNGPLGGWIPWLAVDLGTIAHVQWVKVTNLNGGLGRSI